MSKCNIYSFLNYNSQKVPIFVTGMLSTAGKAQKKAVFIGKTT